MTIPAKTKTLTSTTERTSSNSHRRHHLTAIAFVILVAIMIVSVITGIGFGSIQLSPSDVVKGLFGPSDFQWHRVVWGVRFPRVVLAALVGMNLATSGVILQAVMSNPLADPSIIGVSSGAGLLGIGTLLVFPERANLVPVMAFIGAMLAAMAIYALAWRGGVQPLRIILSGVAVSALCGAGISAVMVLMADNVQGALMFMNGSLAMRSWAEVSLIWPYTVVGIIAAVVLSRRLDIITLGDQVAQG
ncbi:MAG: iron ABC transporter permease, partial [Actinomycetota bacterium]